MNRWSLILALLLLAFGWGKAIAQEADAEDDSARSPTVDSLNAGEGSVPVDGPAKAKEDKKKRGWGLPGKEKKSVEATPTSEKIPVAPEDKAQSDDSANEQKTAEPKPKESKPRFNLLPSRSRMRSLFGTRKKRRKTTLTLDYETSIKEGYSPRPSDSHPGSVLGGALAVMPGVFVHGVGHMYIGETRTGLSLLLAEAVGLGLMFGAAAINESDSGSARTAPARLALSHTGFILFFASWLADIVGTFKGSEPFERDRFRVGGSRLNLGYIYTDNPIDDLRHHALLSLFLDLGRVYINPSIALELQLDQRRMKFDSGVVALVGADPHNRLSLGVEVERIENQPEGWASMTVLGYIAWRADLGVLLRSLGHFYLVNRTGIGQARYQYSSRSDHVPALFAPVESRDEYLFLETGIAVNLSKRSQLTMLISHDPMSDIAPAQLEDVGSLSPEFELFKLQFKHRYLNDVEIETEIIGGTGYGVRLGLGYAL